MALYQASPIQRKVAQAVPGFPAYALGSLNTDVAATAGNVVQVALASPTATVRLLVKAGQIPVANQLISIVGVTPAYFNVTNAKILTVSSAVNTPDDGTYDVTFTLTNANIGTTSATGHFVAPQIEVGDSLTLGGTGTWYSAAIATQMNTGPNNGRSVRFDVSFPITNTSSAVITAQSADVDLDTEYVDLGTVGTLVAGVGGTQSAVFANTLQRFVRFKVSGISAASTSTVVGKVEV